MEGEVSRWLRKQYRSAFVDGPTYIQQKKKIKFEDIHQALSEQFPTKSFSVVSDAIKAAFSKTYSKLVGISRTKHIFGLEANLSVALPDRESTSCTHMFDMLQREQEEKRKLEERVRLLEGRVHELEQAHCLPLCLSSEVNATLNPTNAVYHGPGTLEHFQEFSIDGVMCEFLKFAPEPYKLFTTFG